MLPLDVDVEHAYIKMGVDYLPITMKGVFIASMFAALMSTLSTNVNMSASFIVNDIYKHYFVKEASDKKFVFVSRLSTVGMMLLGLVMWQLMKHDTILNNLKLIMMLIAGGGFVQFISFFWWRVNAWSVVTGMVSSVIITSFIKWGLPYLHPFFREYNITTDHYPIGLLIIVLSTTAAWVIISLLTPPTKIENLKDFYERTRPMGFWGVIKKALGPEFEGDRVRKHEFAAVFGGIMAVFGFIFGLGKVLLGSYFIGVGLFILSALGLKIFLWAMGKNKWWHRNIDAIRAEEEKDKAI